MAESIAVHFKSTKWDELKRSLDSIGLPIEPERWQYPRHGEPCVGIYPYDDLLNEYEDEDIDRLLRFLGDFPSSIVCIELRRSQGNRACDCATEVAIVLLKQFEGIVDDLLSTCWTLEEIAKGVKKDTGKFLDCYRVT
jgi:hypothetical protein